MSAVYAFVLLVSLAYAQAATSQGTGSFGVTERAALDRLFDGYSATFFNEDYAKLRDYLQAPFVRFGPSNTRAEAGLGDWVVLRTMDDTITFFRTGRDALKAQRVERFEWGQTRIIALSADRALVNKSYRRSRKDGTVVAEEASVYVVTKSSGSWKICGIMNQDLGEFGKTH